VRDQADALERTGFIRVRRERRLDGSERLFYAPGLVTLAALADFVERFPYERTKPLRAQAPMTPPTSVRLAAAASVAPPEEASMELRDQDQIEPSCCGTDDASPMPETGGKQADVSKEDREVARRALAERMARKHPTRRPPRWFDAGEVAMAAACAATIAGGTEAKLVAQRDAIAGAFLVLSKDGPPTVRFIWEKLDHFLDHVDRGRRRRLAQEQAARRVTEATTPPRPLPVAPAPMPAEVSVELGRLFGSGRRKDNASRRPSGVRANEPQERQ
jgi:hypothetical protein